ncbi:hypothetical protein [Dictyobacter arantiisoli]|uniref:hypothetical protein n=1 Tax=Dictyobacter arantiisoli TaxID=2014874 RepID=UPI0011EF72F9|nr:hypothetical protein [Dictyobacter arantiisoli]
MDKILIKDFIPVPAFTRVLRHEKYYPGGFVPKREEELRRITVGPAPIKGQLMSLAHWKARQHQQGSHREKDIIASAYASQNQKELPTE